MQLDSELFNVVEKDGMRLILPCHSNAVSNTGWTRKNLWLRSRVECAKTGDTISESFGKFFNLGQGPDELQINIETVLDAIRNNRRIVATLKYDGSCLIRSVYKGEVFLRTRGSLKYTFHDDAEDEMRIFTDKYPRLFDPTWEPAKSLLFEWVTPAAQIVISYSEPDLVLLGAVDHGHRHYSHLKYLTMEQLEPIAAECGVRLTEYFTIDSVKDWYDFYHEVLDHKEIEGYVLRLNDEQDLVKVKSQPYITKHGVKSNLSFKSMVEFWLQHGQEAIYTSILEQLEKLYDEEVVMWALPFVDNLFVAVEAWEKARTKVELDVSTRSHWSRKDFAIEMKKKYTGEEAILFSVAMQLWQGKPIADKMIRSFMERFDNGIKGMFNE
jgi:T4 RnlA family RNA ligase